MAKGRNEDLAQCRLTSEVKSRGEGMCTLAANLSGITGNTRVLCQNVKCNVVISQSLKLGEKTSFQRALIITSDEASSPKKVKAVFLLLLLLPSFQSFSHLGHVNVWAAFHACGSSQSVTATWDKRNISQENHCREVLAFSS